MTTKIKRKIVVEGDEDKSHLGLVHVITGDGKGKTTASIGLAVRAIMQFGVDAVKERQQKLNEFRDKGSTFVFNPDAEEKEAALTGFEHAKKIINSRDCDLLILDEINVVLDKGLIPIEKVLELIREHGNVELVFTGRDAPKEIIDAADYVNIVQKVKNPWDKGIKARKGIEF